MASPEMQITEDSSSIDEDPLAKTPDLGPHRRENDQVEPSASPETEEEVTVSGAIDKDPDQADEEHQGSTGSQDFDKDIDEVPAQNGEHVQLVDGKDPSGEQIKDLSAKLKLALKEVVNKDNLVKQHAKVAEDAISGWEKAEAEAASFKQQLDGAIQQKLVLEERVSHLDGALKECVKQMRSAKEEQEELAKKAKDWDTLRLELEQKLAEASQQATSNAAASEALQQRIGSLTTEASQAQAEARKFAAKVETLEKENASLRHDVRTLKKELVTLNGEAKAAKQQNAESAKKIAKLEAECLKHKGMLRKRATASQGDISDRRKSLGRLTSSPRADSVEDASEIGTRECFALEEEARTLKQVIDRKEKELQAARLMCARTATKLSLVEEQLAALCGTQDKSSLAGLNGQIEALRAFGNNDPASITSQGSCNGDEADGWAAALVAELAQFKKEKEANKADKLLDTTSFELMDDFLEMEKLTSNLPHENGQIWEKREVPDQEGSLDDKTALETALATKEKELAAANETCKALGDKIVDLENRLSVVPSANGHSQSNGMAHGEKASLLQEGLPAVISKIVSVLENLAKDFDSESLPPNFATFKELAASGRHAVQGEQDVLNFMLEVVTALQALDQLWGGSRSSHEDTLKRLDEASVLIKNLEGGLQQMKTDKGAAELSLNAAKDCIAQLEKDLQLVRQALDALNAEKVALLERVSGFESEVSNMKLEKEAAHSRFEELCEELRQTTDARLDASSRQLLKVGEELAQAEAEKDKLAEALETKVSRIAVLEEELRLEKAAAQDSLSAVNVDVEKMVVESAQLKYEKQKLEKALSLAKEQLHEESSTLASHIEALEADLKKALGEKEESQHLVEELKAQLKSLALLEEEAHKLGTEKEAAERSKASIYAECARLRTEKAELEQKLDLAKEKLATQSDSLAAMEEKLKISELQIAKLDHRLSQNEENLQTQQTSFISLQDEYYQLKMEKEDMEQSLAISDQKVHQLQSRLDEEGRSREQSALIYEQQLKALATEKETLAASSEKAVIQLEAELKMEVAEKEKLRQELDSSSKVVEQLQGELQLVTAENEKLNNELDESRNTVDKLEAQLRSIQEAGETKLSQARDSIKHLEEECSRLKLEKMDLEEVLATTDEMVQGVKTECGNLSTVVEELHSLKAEKKDLEDLLQAAHESIESITGEIKKLETEKAEVEHELRLSRVRWESQVFEANDLVASLRAELGLAVKSKQLMEEQLTESFSGKADLQFQVKAAQHEASQLEEQSRNLELELGKERQASQEALSQVESLRQQISRSAEKGSENGTSSARSIHENFDVAAKLDECHRAILSLGQQLQSLSASKTSPSMTEQSTSEESINNKNNSSMVINHPSRTTTKDEASTPDVFSSSAAAANVGSDDKDTGSSAAVENGDSSAAADQGKMFLPSIPLEGRARSKSMSPAKPKSSRNSSKSSAEELSKSLDMGSPSEKPPTSSSSSSAFSRFFRGKSSSHHHH